VESKGKSEGESERERKITCTVIEAIDYVRERISKQLRCTC